MKSRSEERAAPCASVRECPPSVGACWPRVTPTRLPDGNTNACPRGSVPACPTCRVLPAVPASGDGLAAGHRDLAVLRRRWFDGAGQEARSALRDVLAIGGSFDLEFAGQRGTEVDTQETRSLSCSERQRCGLGVAAQRAIAAQSWDDGVAPRVRMGLHTCAAPSGERELRWPRGSPRRANLHTRPRRSGTHCRARLLESPMTSKSRASAHATSANTR